MQESDVLGSCDFKCESANCITMTFYDFSNCFPEYNKQQKLLPIWQVFKKMEIILKH